MFWELLIALLTILEIMAIAITVIVIRIILIKIFKIGKSWVYQKIVAVGSVTIFFLPIITEITEILINKLSKIRILKIRIVKYWTILCWKDIQAVIKVKLLKMRYKLVLERRKLFLSLWKEILEEDRKYCD